MSAQKSNYDLLVNKLDHFIRKFYLNQIIRGSLYSIAVIIGLFLFFNLLEHQFYFSGGVRKVILFGFLGITVLALGFWVINPALRYFRLGRQISHEQAASIIGSHFASVEDRLLNILQLKRQAGQAGSSELIHASIEQKTDEIKLVPFRAAIDLGKNKKYLRYALPPALFLLVMLFAAPSLITEPAHRIINNNIEFEKKAPFRFVLADDSPEVIQYEDLTLLVDIEGSAIPNEAFIEVDGFRYRMKPVDKNTFSYTFNNVQKDVTFSMFANRVRSRAHNVKVLLRPNINNFTVTLDYPSYTGRKDERIYNTGDMLVPAGTRIKWDFEAENTDRMSMAFGNNSEPEAAQRQGQNRYGLEKRVYKDQLYKVYTSNDQLPAPDSVSYIINVTQDQYPEISVEVFKDSTENNLVYFIGNASDDYGLKYLSFNYSIAELNGTETTHSETILNPTSRETDYDYILDISALQLKPGDKLSYYFEVFDNDAVNGSKSARTSVIEFEKPTVEEFEEKEDANEDEIRDKLEASIEESRKIREELKKMREKLLQKQEPDWEDRKEFEKLMERQENLQQQLQEAKEKFEENLKNQEEFTERPEELQEKQERMKELFEEALDPETQDLMDKIQELLQELNKEDMIQMMENMEMSEEAMEKNNERLLELFKNLEMEKEIQDLTKKLEELAEEQENLADKTDSGEETNEDLADEQEKINEEFEKLQEKLDEMMKKNKELERPKDLGEDTPEQMDDIRKDMEDGKEQLEQNQNNKASQKQKSASQKMKNMAQSMQSSMQSQSMDQMQEDIAALRQLLENLVTLSFDQEDLINSIKRVNINTPSYVAQIQEQFKLKDDFGLIQDSLQALAKRVDQIETFVTEKVVEIETNMEESIDQLEERQTHQAEENQRHTMKNVNDLALMLSETMQDMQEQMSGMMAGSQMCNKPGGMGKSGQVPMDKITEGQEDLNEGLQKMKEGEGKGDKGSAREFAEAAARQAALRRALEELQQQKMEQGQGSKELQDIIEQMDKVEIDLVNKRLDNELLLRQKDILTRLLEAEKAEREREFENKRKAESADDIVKELPPSLKEYLKERESQIDMYKEVSPALRPYYRQLVDAYYRALKSN